MNLDLPLMTRALALRIGKSEADHFGSWLSVMQSQKGNPFAIEIRRFGHAVAFVNQGMTLGPLFNRVLGFGDAEAGFLDEIVRFYEERDIACRIDINPYNASPTLFDHLAESGLRPFRFHNHLYGSVLALTPPEDAGPISAREVRPQELSVWANVWLPAYAESLGVSQAMAGQIADATQCLYGQPGWRLYLAFVEGQPAASGALYTQDGIGSVLIGGTLPVFRRRGCQLSLLRARIAEAACQGCDLIVAQAGLDTTSQHNMERVGMRTAYTRAFWLRR